MWTGWKNNTVDSNLVFVGDESSWSDKIIGWEIVLFYLFRPLKITKRKIARDGKITVFHELPTNHRPARDEGVSGGVWIYGFMSQCETFLELRGLESTRLHWTKTWTVWEWRGNGLSSLNSYHQGTLNMSLCLSPNCFSAGRLKRCGRVQQSAAPRQNVPWKHQQDINKQKNIYISWKLPVFGRWIEHENYTVLARFYPCSKITMTGQEIDNVIAYFVEYLGQFVTFLTAHSVPVNFSTLHTKSIELNWQEWILLDRAWKMKSNKNDEETFSSGSATHNRDASNSPLIQSGKESDGMIWWIIHKPEFLLDVPAFYSHSNMWMCKDVVGLTDAILCHKYPLNKGPEIILGPQH